MSLHRRVKIFLLGAHRLICVSRNSKLSSNDARESVTVLPWHNRNVPRSRWCRAWQTRDPSPCTITASETTPNLIAQ